MSSFKPSVILLIKESDFADLPKIINYNSINDKLSKNIRNYGVGAQILKKLKMKDEIKSRRTRHARCQPSFKIRQRIMFAYADAIRRAWCLHEEITDVIKEFETELDRCEKNMRKKRKR